MRHLSCVSTDPQGTDFPAAKQLLKSRNETTYKNSPREQAPPPAEELTRHFISSWDQSQQRPGSMAQMIQAHWCCESRHWQRDACWQEDRCRLRSPNAACALALIRATLQSLVHWVDRASLPEVFEDVAHDLSLGLGWLKSRQLDR